jgi:signal transduction histidine kinase
VRGRGFAVAGLAAVGILLLAVSTVIELSDISPRTELGTGIAAGTVFLLAMACSRGADSEVLALRARLLVGAGLSALLAVAALWQATERSAPRVLLLLVPVCLLFGTAALALREAAAQRRQAHLREVAARLEGEERERQHWVRELHDDTLQDLAAVTVLLAASGNESAAREVVGRQIHALRRLIAQMRPLALDTMGLYAAIEDLARHQQEATGIETEVSARVVPDSSGEGSSFGGSLEGSSFGGAPHGGSPAGGRSSFGGSPHGAGVHPAVAEAIPRLSADAETSIYRIVQEALTNAVRHSGATHITVELRSDSRHLEVTVRDDGGGYPFVPGHGLRGMRERAETLGARLRISGDASGTEVRLTTPSY